MRKKSPHLLSITFILIFACNTSNHETGDLIIDSFPESIHVKSTPVESIDILSSGNVNLVVVDTFLIVQRDEVPMLQVFNTNNHELLVSFGEQGRSPTGFEGPDLIKQVAYDSINGSPIIHVFDYQRRRISKINLIDAIKDKDKAIQQRRIEEFDGYLIRFFYEDNDITLARAEGNSRFVLYNHFNSKVTNIPYLQEIDFLDNQFEYSDVFRSAVTVNKERNLFATGSMLLGELEFYDLKGQYIKSTIFSPRKGVRKAKSDGSLMTLKLQIMDIQSTENRIYALNYNNLQVDVHKKTGKNNAKLQVFDWDGNPIKEYILADNLYISYFAFDEINNRIYGYAPDIEENNLVIYSLDQ